MRAAWVAISLSAWALLGCTASREILPRLDSGAEAPARKKYPFCPTKIDVYGGPNVLLSGSGGPTQLPSSLPDGASTPGTAEYDNSLASELRDLLMQNAELQAKFGSVAWRVRSCAGPRGSLLQLSQTVPLDNCGPDTPQGVGQLAAMCTNDPAPVLLLSAENVDDRCHGGGADSREADDLPTFQDHFKRRLEAFLDVRKPQLALIGPQTEWIPSPFQSGGQNGGVPPTVPDPGGCLWRRSDWNADGIDLWASDPSNLMGVYRLPDLHDQFKLHHLCCGSLGLPCSDVPWYVFSAGGQGSVTALNPIGAGIMIQFWGEQLKAVLLANDFTCPADAGAP